MYLNYVGSSYYQYGETILTRTEPARKRCWRHFGSHCGSVIGSGSSVCHEACAKVASATLRLCNTPDSVYSAANPERAIGGIRFKLTRQWFRVDTIQHVASFYLKPPATEATYHPEPLTENLTP